MSLCIAPNPLGSNVRGYSVLWSCIFDHSIFNIELQNSIKDGFYLNLETKGSVYDGKAFWI